MLQGSGVVPSLASVAARRPRGERPDRFKDFGEATEACDWDQSPCPHAQAADWIACACAPKAMGSDGKPSLWRPAKLITVRFGSAPSSRDRIDDHGVRVRPWAVAIPRPAIRSCCGDRRSGRVSRGRSPDICRPSSSANRRSCCRTAVFAPMHSPANSSDARRCKRPPDPGLGRVQREFCR